MMARDPPGPEINDRQTCGRAAGGASPVTPVMVTE